MTEQFTQGPLTWKAQGEANEYMVFSASGNWLFSIRHNGEQSVAEQEANMRMVTESAKLYKVLKAILELNKKEALQDENADDGEVDGVQYWDYWQSNELEELLNEGYAIIKNINKTNE